MKSQYKTLDDFLSFDGPWFTLRRLAQTSAEQPAIPPKYEVEIEQDVIYSIAEGYWAEGRGAKGKLDFMFRKKGKPAPLELKMDIYKPVGDGDAGRPLLILSHGGAYYNGSKDELGQVEWCRYFASIRIR